MFGFWGYYRTIASSVWQAVWKNVWQTVLALIGATVPTVILAIKNINPSSQTLTRSIASAVWPLGILVLYLLAHAVRAPWKLHHAEVVAHKNTRAELAREIEDLKGGINELGEVLKRERENLDGCPIIILGYREETEHGFFVVPSIADSVAIQLEPARSPRYLLTSERIPHAANGIPQYPLELHVELTVEASGYTKSADGQEAWKVFARDLWPMKRPLQLAETPEKMFTEFVNAAVNQALVVPLRITYRDLSGRSYTSAADVAWEPLFGSVQEIRLGAIRKVPC